MIDKGIKTVDVDISSHGTYTCADVCTAAGGKCANGQNGAGWVDYKFNDGSGTTGNRVSACDEPEDYATSNVTMTDMSCYCDGLTIPSTVRVAKGEGLFACTIVCSTWSRTCSTTRKSVAYTDAAESSQSVLSCGAVPASNTDHYVCACDP